MKHISIQCASVCISIYTYTIFLRSSSYESWPIAHTTKLLSDGVAQPRAMLTLPTTI